MSPARRACLGHGVAGAERIERKVAESYRERVEAAAAPARVLGEPLGAGHGEGHLGDHRAAGRRHRRPVLRSDRLGGRPRCRRSGARRDVAITDRDPSARSKLVRALRGQRPRGLILAASRSTDSPTPRTSARTRCPLLGGRPRRGARPRSGRAAHRSIIDNRGGAQALGAALAGRGYRNAIILAAHEGVRTRDDRIAGFTAGFTAAGGAVDRIYRGGLTRESGVAHDGRRDRRGGGARNAGVRRH